MSELVDARGLSCPEPVLRARRALQATTGGKVTILVSTAAARDNVTRTAASLGWRASVESTSDGFRLTLVRR